MWNWLKKVKRYLHNDAVAVDQTLNVFGGGHPDETISSRSQRAADAGNPVGKVISEGLDLIQKDHGHLAEQGDRRRAEKILEIEPTTPPQENH